MRYQLTETEASWLLYDLCVSLGFCLPPEAQEKLAGQPPADVDEFAAAVCLAEGLDPMWNMQLYKQVRVMIAAAFEASRSLRRN